MEKLSTLDFVCWLMDRAERPLDFTLVIRAPNIPDLDRLRAGARSARRRYPVSLSTTDGRRWIRRIDPPDDNVQVSRSGGQDTGSALQEFVDREFDLRTGLPVAQLLLDDGAGDRMLATRFHHAAADGASAAMWLTHQLRVAREEELPWTQAGGLQPPELRRPRPKAGYKEGQSARMWRRPRPPSRSRRWRTFEIPGGALREAVRAAGRFTYNDLLSTIALDVLIGWNREHAAGQIPVGLWLPVDVRRAGSTAFGNGTSRIRLHAGFSSTASWIDKASAVHGEISRAMSGSEWAVPAAPPLTQPGWLMLPLLRAYLGRPWADIGTATFSHADRWGGEPRAFFDRVERIACVGPLHARQCLTMTGVTYRHRTWMTFTFDPAQLAASDVDRLAAMFEERVVDARRELLRVGESTPARFRRATPIRNEI
jgi:hypothetical protein